MTDTADEQGIGQVALVGIAVCSVGGPLAIVALDLPSALGPAVSGAAFTVVLGAAAFLPLVLVWWRCSAQVSSGGGLAAFVEAAAGRRLALVQAVIWLVAYVLYVPYTLTDHAYNLMPIVLPGIGRAGSGALQFLLAGAVLSLVLLPLRRLAFGLGIVAVLQLAVLVAFSIVELRSGGIARIVPATGFAAGLRGVAGGGLLLLCLSLPLFLGGETGGGGRALRRALVVGGSIAVAFVAVAALGLGAAVDRVGSGGDLPGYAIAAVLSGTPLARLVGGAGIVSEFALMVVEYLAVTRLVRWAFGWPVRRTVAWLTPVVLALLALALLDPERFYHDALVPSLAALYVSQLVLLGAYPFLRRRVATLDVLDIAAVLAGAALIGWGLWLVMSGQVGS